MTLRHDRLDNFWFTLAHELAHLYLHLNSAEGAFFDDTEHSSSKSCDPIALEANDLTREMLIPRETWNEVNRRFQPPPNGEDVRNFADMFPSVPAIVAG
jgi:HTH-type transcriptional regulator/antitoxin HigA